MPAKLVIDNAKLQAALTGPDGMVTRNLIKKTERFKMAARRQIKSKTGCLESSILKRILPNGTIVVISDTSPCSPTHKSYSLFVHEGTDPHDIFPKKGKYLRFRWPNGPEGNKVYFFTMVHHPGTKPNRFFTDNLYVITH